MNGAFLSLDSFYVRRYRLNLYKEENEEKEWKLQAYSISIEDFGWSSIFNRLKQKTTDIYFKASILKER